MTIKLEIFLLILVTFFILLILHTIKNHRLLLKYSLLWLASSLVMIICILFPSFLSIICNILGIELVSNLVFLISFFILLVLTFALTIIVSEQKKKIVLLVEEIAIIKKEIKEIKNDKRKI